MRALYISLSLVCLTMNGRSQTLLKISDTIPGSENVQLVYNGYFVYRSFTTADTGSTVTLRAFYDGFVGAGTASAYCPIGAQWDNLAITKETDFLPPQPGGSAANIRPQVSIYSPGDGTNILFESSPASLQIAASASDVDGTISKVEFYAGPNKLGQVTSGSYVFTWSNIV